MPDPRKILRSKSANNFLTGKFAERILKWLVPLGNIRVFGEDGTEYKVDYSDTSVHITLKAMSGAAQEPEEEQTVTGMFFRGEWTATPVDLTGNPAPYKAGHLVVVRGGSYAGTYVCVKDNPSAIQQPPNGVYWVQLSQTTAIGQWT